MQQGSGCGTQTFDDMPLVETPRPSQRGTVMDMKARQLNDLSRADPAHPRVVLERQSQLLPPEARRHTLQETADTERTRDTDPATETRIIGRARVR